MSAGAPPRLPGVDAELRARISALSEEGWEIWRRFDTEVRQNEWHPFVPADYEVVLDALITLRAPGLRFLEWGSATGVITIIADLLGFEAYGLELDADLVGVARGLAERYGSSAKFVAGSFIPSGYKYRPKGGDGRIGTIGDGASGYPALGHPLEDFDLVFGYPWHGEEPLMHDLMRAYGGRGARLLLHGGGTAGVRVFRDGKQVV
ncbi:MAG: hypothetical protein AVDCRST_MAG89-5070 [uncultured Gemmatimonadetes bacterium]|uniref:Methyltransferase domain-containing protein n=1 Tax=uncultured Gemmatimonadota bacterium TaxID=203437 RepID=A0A6J4N9Q1_9BACT|nr:MAG: hypothetical protein AVDCRST_MAG89-5070 [uncultured Gemmatimonadota bacterium]